MFKKISLITTLLFFLIGTNVFANSNSETSKSQTVTYKAVNQSIKPTQTSSMTIKKAELTWENYVVPAAVCLFMIIIFGGYWFVLRKKLFTK